MDYTGSGRRRLERIEVVSFVRTIFLITLFVAALLMALALGTWQALRSLELVDLVEDLSGKLAGGVFGFDEGDLLVAFLLVDGLLVLTVTAFAGVGAAVYNQVAESVGGFEVCAEVAVRRSDVGLARAFSGRRRRGAAAVDPPDTRDPIPSVEPLALRPPPGTESPGLEEAAATVAAPDLVAIATGSGHVHVAPPAKCTAGLPSAGGVSAMAPVSDGRGLAALSPKGRIFHVRAGDGPPRDRNPRPGDGQVVALLDRAALESAAYVVFVSELGYVKRTSAREYPTARRSGARAAQIGSDDRLVATLPTSGDDEIVIVTREGMALRVSELEFPPRSRQARGSRGIRLRGDDRVVSATRVEPQTVLDLFTVTAAGYGKRTSLDEFRLQRRGGRGLRAAVVTPASGEVAAAVAVAASDDVLLGSSGHTLARLAVTDVRHQTRNSTGARLVPLERDERVTAATVFPNR